jgi:hypothetical protein
VSRKRRKLKAGRFAALAGDFWRNPKRHQLSHAAQALHVAAMSYAADQLSDGHVPDYMLAALAGGIAGGIAEELVDVGWWERNEAGFQLKAFADYNPTRSEIEEQSAAQAARARARWGPVGDATGTPGGNPPPDPRPLKHSSSAERGRALEAPPLPDPPTDVEPTALRPGPAAKLRRAIAERYADAHRDLTGCEWPEARFRAERQDLASILEREASARGEPPEALLDAVLRSYVADEWVREKRPNIGYLVRELHRFLPERKSAEASALDDVAERQKAAFRALDVANGDGDDDRVAEIRRELDCLAAEKRALKRGAA